MATVAGLLSNIWYELSPRLAVPAIIVVYLLGGWQTGYLILYGVYFHQLMAVGWPKPEELPSLVSSAAMSKLDFAGYPRSVIL